MNLPLPPPPPSKPEVFQPTVADYLKYLSGFGVLVGIVGLFAYTTGDVGRNSSTPDYDWATQQCAREARVAAKAGGNRSFKYVQPQSAEQAALVFSNFKRGKWRTTYFCR